MRISTAALAIGVVGLAVLAPSAGADHGYQSFDFKNKTDEKAFDIKITFTRALSHIGDDEPTWEGAKCKLKDDNTVVECDGGDRLKPGESFELSVATPPPATTPPAYVEAEVDFWNWTNKKGKRLGPIHNVCDKKDGCKDLGATVPSAGR